MQIGIVSLPLADRKIPYSIRLLWQRPHRSKAVRGAVQLGHSNHRGTRLGFSELEPRRIGELPVEGATDGIDEHSVGGANL